MKLHGEAPRRRLTRLAPILGVLSFAALVLHTGGSWYIGEISRERTNESLQRELHAAIGVALASHLDGDDHQDERLSGDDPVVEAVMRLDLVAGLAVWQSDALIWESEGMDDMGFPSLELVDGFRRLPSDNLLTTIVAGERPRKYFAVEVDGRTYEARVTADLEPQRNNLTYAVMLLWSVTLIAVLIWTRRLERMSDLHESQAKRDPLTGLPNRVQLAEDLDHHLRSSGMPFAMLLMDLNGFKQVNDTLGHNFGDDLLVLVSDRFRGVLRDGDILVRLGGDEFAVFSPSSTSPEQALAAAREFQATLRKPFFLDGHHIDVGVSVGAALYPDHGSDRHTLLKRADIAMYNAKATHSGVEMYDTGTDPHSTEQLSLSGQLRAAFGRNELFVEYQPIQRLDGRGPHLYESLVRWNHPVRGPIAPVEFIDLAAQGGMVTEMTLTVLRLAVAQCSAWVQQGLDVAVSVNVFPENASDPEFVAEVTDILAGYNLDPSRLVLEITERAELELAGPAMGILHQLTELGVRVAIDDFGSGAWSLGHVRKLDISMLKLDADLVDSAIRTPADRAVIEATTAMAHTLGLEVVAEGIESPAHLEVVKTCGVDMAQGFFLSRPVAATSVPALEQMHDELSS